jgi:hypothetical protein
LTALSGAEWFPRTRFILTEMVAFRTQESVNGG